MSHTLALTAHLDAVRADTKTFRAYTRERMGGSMAGILANFLHDYANGMCVSCGLPTVRGGARNAPDTAEVGHLISATYAGGDSKNREGWMPGNLANMCHTCNTDAAQTDMSFTASDLLMPELVPLMWPVMRKGVRTESDYANRARSMRNW